MSDMTNNRSQTQPALWATQGGGLAHHDGFTMVWFEVPDDLPEAQVGDPIPDRWGIMSANDAAIDCEASMDCTELWHNHW